MKNLATRVRIGVSTSLCILFGLTSAIAVAPDLSSWQVNLSADSAEQLTRSEDPEVVAVGNTVHLLQTTTALTNSDIKRLYYVRSVNGGKSFEPPILLEEHPGLDFGRGRFRRLAVDGQTVHVVSTRAPVWTGGGWYYALDYYRSANNGASFEARRSLATGDPAWHLHMPHVAASNGKVTIAYLYYPNWYTDSTLGMFNSEDGGVTFSQKVVAHTGAEGYDLWDLFRDGNKIAVAFVASKGIPGSYSSTFRLMVGASTDGGANWHINQVCRTNASGWPQAHSLSDYNEKPDVAWAGNTLYVTWTGQDTNSVNATFVARSVDNGMSFEPQINLSSGKTGEPQYGQATVAARGQYAYVVWNVPGSGIWLSHTANGGASWSAPRWLYGGWWPMVAVDPAVADGSRAFFLANPGYYRMSGDGGETLSGMTCLTTLWAWRGNGLSTFQWSVGPNSTLHLAWTGVQQAADGSDYDLYYRKYDPSAPALSSENQCLLLQSDRESAWFDSLQIAADANLDLTSALTVEMWVRPDTNCPWESVILMQEHADHYKGSLRLQTHSWSGARRPSASVLTTNELVSVWGGEALNDGEWHHLALTYNAAGGRGNLRLYVDGHLSATATGIGPVKPSVYPIYIGGAAGGTYSAFSGGVDEVRFWNRALSETEIRTRTTWRARTAEPGLAAYYPLDGSLVEALGNGRPGVLMYREYFAANPRSLPVRLTSVPMTTAAVGSPFLFEFAADWATGFAVKTGNLPPGLGFNAALGVFSGTPVAAGAYDLVLVATNETNAAEQTLRIVVNRNDGLLFRDDFNNGTNASWTVLRDANDAGYYSFYPGGMRLRSHWGDLWAGSDNIANLFTTPNPAAGDFNVTLGVSKFKPGPINWVQLFLTAYDNDNNYLRYSYGWADGTMVSVVNETSGQPRGANFAADFGDRPFLLRLSKQGNQYLASWSTNGVDFVDSHEPMPYGDGTPEKLAFWLGSDSQQTNVVLLDSFEVKAGAVPFFTSAPLTGARRGTPFAWKMDGPNGCVFAAQGLPAGLSIDAASGLISGVPVAGGIFDSVITASNHNGVARQNLRLIVSDSDGWAFRDDFQGTFASGWDPLPTDTSYYQLTNGCQLWLRANNGDTWQWYNRGLNLFTIPAPGTNDWVATLALSRYEPTAVDYNSIHLVAWKDTDNSVRLDYSHGGGNRSVGIASENAQVMQSFGVTTNLGSGPFLLRLVKKGNSYSGYFSRDGITFVPASAETVQLNVAAEKIGFWMGIDPTLANVAMLDYFEVISPAAPRVTSQPDAPAQLRDRFSFQVASANEPAWFTATGLPAGLTIHPQTGVITGVPLQTGNFPVQVIAGNDYGSNTFTLNLAIGYQPLPGLTSPAMQAIRDAQSLSFAWVGQSNAVYEVQSSANLTDWTAWGQPVLGQGQPISLTVPMTNAPAFFRIQAK